MENLCAETCNYWGLLSTVLRVSMSHSIQTPTNLAPAEPTIHLLCWYGFEKNRKIIIVNYDFFTLLSTHQHNHKHESRVTRGPPERKISLSDPDKHTFALKVELCQQFIDPLQPIYAYEGFFFRWQFNRFGTLKTFQLLWPAPHHRSVMSPPPVNAAHTWFYACIDFQTPFAPLFSPKAIHINTSRAVKTDTLCDSCRIAL